MIKGCVRTKSSGKRKKEEEASARDRLFSGLKRLSTSLWTTDGSRVASGRQAERDTESHRPWPRYLAVSTGASLARILSFSVSKRPLT